MRGGGTGGFVDGAGAAVLGPATLEGIDLTPRQRAIVAALVYHRKHGATTEMLIDAVWGVDAPPSARPSLQNQIARLRKRFGEEVIVTDSAKYHLRRGCDVDEFERSIRQLTSRPARAADSGPLRNTLELWRGVPFVDLVDHLGAESERARLIELEAVAAEHLAACRIVAGDHSGAALHLVGLVEADPYRERRWELLILALCAGDRRAEALAVFRRLSLRLAQDLHCRPSPAVQHLNALIERTEPIDIRAHLDAGMVQQDVRVRTVACARRPQQRQRTGCAGSYRHE